jgi:hypothetical protein
LRFQPRILPTGGWEAAVTGTLEVCLYTAKVRWLATSFVKDITPVINRTGDGDIPLLGEREQNMSYHPKEGCNQAATVLKE